MKSLNEHQGIINESDDSKVIGNKLKKYFKKVSISKNGRLHTFIVSQPKSASGNYIDEPVEITFDPMYGDSITFDSAGSEEDKMSIPIGDIDKELEYILK